MDKTIRDWEDVVLLIRHHSLKCRVVAGNKLDDEWSDWASCPSPGYLESSGNGPIPFALITRIDICTKREVWRGKLQPVSDVDCTDVLLEALAQIGAQVSVCNDVVQVKGFAA